MTDSFRAEVLKNLGTNLRKIRIEKGLTTADVALHCDLSLNSINEIEKGNKVSFTKFKKFRCIGTNKGFMLWLSVIVQPV